MDDVEVINQAPPIHGNRVLLRKPEEKDIEDRLRCGRTVEWLKMVGGDTRKMAPFTLEDGKKWFRKINSNPLEWVIEYEKSCIGTARLTVNETDHRARFAIGIFDMSKLNLGLGTEVTKLVLEYAFCSLKLHKVDLRVLEYNKRAIACYEKCGFVIEGKDREGAYIEDQYHTDLFMSILEQEYMNTKNSLNKK